MARAALENVSIEERADSLLSLFQTALSARGQLGWSQWLRGEIQGFLPHDALIAAWGDFRSGELAFDVITCSPSMSVRAIPAREVERFVVALFGQWIASGHEPVALEAEVLRSASNGSFAQAKCALVHGVQDHRSRTDCIYIFLGPQDLASPFSRQLARMMLPFIDTGFRQLADRGEKQAQEQLSWTGFACSSFAHAVSEDARRNCANCPAAEACGEALAGEQGSALTPRELEIMQWVRMGKTNYEIGMILDLSTFTVKNHMRRIYKKLDVLNRAQAVGSLDRMNAASQAATR